MSKQIKQPSERVLRTRAFKAAGLTKAQISYAHTLKYMYSSWDLNKVIEESRKYITMSEAVLGDKPRADLRVIGVK
jgi:hypothetical protein